MRVLLFGQGETWVRGGGGGEVLRVLSSRSKGEQALTEAPGTLKVVESLICRRGKKEVLKRVKISKVK